MKKKMIYALGYFDGVHLGHRALLSACRELAQEQKCQCGAVTFSPHPQQLLSGDRVGLINTDEDREEMLLFYVNTVRWLTFTESLRAMAWQDFLQMLVEKHSAAGFVCGTDFRFGRKGEGTAVLLQQFCREHNLSCSLVEQQSLDGIRISSTHIRKLLEKGNIREANRFLGHPHMLTGVVQSGKQLGRTIGIPTANLAYPEELLHLPYGVYACKVQFEGKTYPAITNIGVRPTVSGEGVTVESHLFNFFGDLYGKTVEIFFCDFIRPEQKFSDLAQLKAQIEKDMIQTKRILAE